MVRLTTVATNCLVELKQGTEASSPQPPGLIAAGRCKQNYLSCTTGQGLTGYHSVDERPYSFCGVIKPRNRTAYEHLPKFPGGRGKTVPHQQGTGWRRQDFEINEGESFRRSGRWVPYAGLWQEIEQPTYPFYNEEREFIGEIDNFNIRRLRQTLTLEF